MEERPGPDLVYPPCLPFRTMSDADSYFDWWAGIRVYARYCKRRPGPKSKTKTPSLNESETDKAERKGVGVRLGDVLVARGPWLTLFVH